MPFSGSIVLVRDLFFDSRKKALEEAGFVVSGISGFVVPEVIKCELPRDYASRVACAQVEFLRNRNQSTGFPDISSCPVPLGLVTIVCCGRRILGVPGTEAQARSILRLLSGRRHRVLSCIALDHFGQVKTRMLETGVQIKPLGSRDLECVLSLPDGAVGKEGGYLPLSGIQKSWVRSIQGIPGNLEGMPLYPVVNMLNGLGLRV